MPTAPVTTSLPAKKQVVLTLLERSTVFLHLDPRRDGVRVPPWYKNEPQLILQIGLNMAVPIPDLNVDDECVSCTLSFSRTPFFCLLPWGAIYGIVGEDGRGMVWPDDVPPEVASQLRAQQQKAERPSLRAVPAPAEPAPPQPRAAVEKIAARRSKRDVIAEPIARRLGDEAGDAAARPARGKRKGKLAPATKPRPDAERQRPAAKPAPALQPEARPAPGAPARLSSAKGGKQGKRELPPYLRVVK